MIGDGVDDEEVSEPGKIINEPSIELRFANNTGKFRIPCENSGKMIIEEDKHMIFDEVEYTKDSRSSF